jgi:hypothetical protein
VKKLGFFPRKYAPATGEITDAMLAADIKVGSLGSLTTDEQSSIQAALNEVDGHADGAQGEAEAKYTLPGDGIPDSDMTAAVQSSLDLADSSYQLPGDGIPDSDMTTAVQSSLDLADSSYQLPEGGIPDSDMTAGVQGSLGKADSAYQLPGDGIPDSDMTAAVQASLDKADGAVQSDAKISIIRVAKVKLNGWASTPVIFKAATIGKITGMSGPVDMVSIGNNGTIKLTGDSQAEETFTLLCAAGFHTGGTSASQDMTADVDNKFKISVDSDTPEVVACDWVGGSCDSGAEIATEMQSKIQALGGKKALVTVAFSTNKYVITATTLGKNSKIRITAADDHDACDDLQIGAGYGSYTDGTGSCNDVKAVTVDEIGTLINATATHVAASNVAGTLTISSLTSGAGSRALAGAGTLNTLCGIPNTEAGYGSAGMGYASDMADVNYIVVATLTGAAAAAAQGLATNNKATTGFDLTCETTAKTDYVDIMVVGLGS